MRKLASIRTIDRLTPIEGADRIETAHIDGWQVVVGKDQYTPGDKVVYCEIDSAIPLDLKGVDPDGNLAKRGTKKLEEREYFIVKTIRLRGQVSQGIVFPTSIICPLTWWQKTKAFFNFPLYSAGSDVTEHLGVIKYDPYSPTWRKRATKGPSGKLDPDLIGPFPTNYAVKSDSERVQNLTKWWDKVARHEWVLTEKIDGQSVTIFNDGESYRVATRNYERKQHPALEWARNNEILDHIKPGYAIQGEWAGPGVQGNKLKLKENRLFVFDFFVNGAHKSIPKGLEQWQVPLIRCMSLEGMSVEDVINLANGLKSEINPDRQAEGIVFYECDGVKLAELGGRYTFKAINNTWLLGEDS